MRILGISCFYHESAAALISDGEIIAASQEERFTRKKHDFSFPQEAIEFCLKQGKIKADELDYVVFYEKPLIKFERNLMVSLKFFPKSYGFFVDSMKNFLTEKLWVKSIIASRLKIDSSRILFVPHHVSHASASFYPSPFERAAYLTLDGVGEWTTGSWGGCLDNRILPIGEMKFPHSVGLLYATFTAFLGFEVNDGEYKVMGMAAYGKPKHVDRIKKLYKQYGDGSIDLALDYFSFHLSSKSMYSPKLVKLFEGLDRFDIASSLQKCTEEIIFKMLNFIQRKTGEENLVFGGGVALNSVLNGKILNKTKFKNVFIFPAAGDDGGAVGSALYIYYHVLNNTKRFELRDVFLGQEFSNLEVESSLKKRGLKFKKMTQSRLLDFISDGLSKGKTVGWFEGRAEFGPRALGHRSILADPRNAEMRDKVNSKIKFREEFRPFAPAVLAEYVDEYFEGVSRNLGIFMLGTFKAKLQALKNSPATVHVDRTSRVQIVNEDYRGSLRVLLKRFYKKTGVPLLLNTSFNLKGEPIVNSPKDAIRTFKNSGLDILVLNNYIIEKPYA